MIQELDTSRGTEVHRISATIRFQLYPVLITLNLLLHFIEFRWVCPQNLQNHLDSNCAWLSSNLWRGYENWVRVSLRPRINKQSILYMHLHL